MSGASLLPRPKKWFVMREELIYLDSSEKDNCQAVTANCKTTSKMKQLCTFRCLTCVHEEDQLTDTGEKLRQHHQNCLVYSPLLICFWRGCTWDTFEQPNFWTLESLFFRNITWTLYTQFHAVQLSVLIFFFLSNWTVTLKLKVK